MKKNPYKERYPKQPCWRAFAWLLRRIFKRPEIVNLAGKLEPKAIYVANHSAMAGPVVYNLYFPLVAYPWGAYPMLGNFKSRYRYLRDVYFMQKRHMGKFGASILAVFDAIFSKFIYKGMHVIPTFPDGRLLKTLRMSLSALENDRPVIIFPENSDAGYMDELNSFSGGFVVLAERYAKIHGEEIPVYPVYYHKNANKLIIGKPKKISDFPEHYTRKQIAAELCETVNDLYRKHVLGNAEAETDTYTEHGHTHSNA